MQRKTQGRGRDAYGRKLPSLYLRRFLSTESVVYQVRTAPLPHRIAGVCVPLLFIYLQSTSPCDSSQPLGARHFQRWKTSTAQKERLHKERKERAVRLREEKVKAQGSKVEAQIDRF